MGGDDGSISREEWVAAMQNEKNAKISFNLSDKEITFREFLSLCADNKTGRYEKLFERISLSIKMKAKHTPPKLSKSDMQQILLSFRSAAATLRGMDPPHLFNRLDRDGDKQLSKQEFQNGIKSKNIFRET